jgi:hypothetical protein
MIICHPFHHPVAEMPAQSRKIKFTASVSSTVNARFDTFLKKLKKTNKSEAIEEAMELWLCRVSEAEDEKYYAQAATEMNADSRDWSTATTASLEQLRDEQ